MEKTTQLIFEKDVIDYNSRTGKPWFMSRVCHCDNCGNMIVYMFDLFDEKNLNKKKITNMAGNQYCDCCGFKFENRAEVIVKDVEDVEAQGE